MNKRRIRNKRNKRKEVLFSVLLFTSMLCHVQPLFSWGFFGHRFINQHAVFLLPPQMYAFYKKHIFYISEHATDADKRRYALVEEGPRHYIDLDKYGAQSLPRKWDDAVALFSADSLQAHGISPWWILIMHARLKKAFSTANAKDILKLSADIGHYIADAHVPLHASSNHDGQHTDQRGIHGFWESRLPEIFAEQKYDMLLGSATYINDPAALIWERVYQSAAASDTVLRVEKQLALQTSLHQRFSFGKRNAKLVKQFSDAYAERYHVRLNGMVERRMQQSVQAIASFWFTAWVDAGQPDLSSLVYDDERQQSATDTLQDAWLRSNIIGRSCSK